MKNVLLLIVSILIGSGAVFGYSQYQKSVAQMNQVPGKIDFASPTPLPSFSIEIPPSESLKGTITSRTGSLKFESRVATEPAELKDTASIEQGTELITEDKSTVTINFDKVASMELGENSDITFAQTLPVDLAVRQTKGSIKYTVIGTTPLSIRVRSALIRKTSGIIQIVMKDDDSIVLISTSKGTAQIGFNDTDNVSQVFTLKEGQEYHYDSDERTVVNASR